MTDFHPGVFCSSCREPVACLRYLCLNCANYNLCESCEAVSYEVCCSPSVSFTFSQQLSHFKGTHSFAKIRDSRTLTKEQVRLVLFGKTDQGRKYRDTVVQNDSFAFATWNKQKLTDSPKALDLVKRMLTKENEYRLGEEYQALYGQSQECGAKVSGIVNVINFWTDRSYCCHPGESCKRVPIRS
jgi:hypothetical protein